MVLPKNVRCAALVAAFVYSAAAQTADPLGQLKQARHLRVQGRYTEAAPLFAAVLRDAQKAQQSSHFVAEVLDDQGLNEYNAGNYGAAEIAFNHSLAMLKGDDALINIVKTHLAELYLFEKRAAEADPLLRQVTASLRSAPVVDRQALALAYNDLAVACALLKKKPQPELLLREALGLLEDEYGPDNPMLISSLNPLSMLLLVERRYSEAVAPAERAWKMVQANEKEIADPDRASVLDILGQVYSHNGRLAEAADCARRASDLAEKVYGPDAVRLGQYLARYAGILNRADRKKEARPVQRRADAILAQASQPSGGGFTVSVSALR